MSASTFDVLAYSKDLESAGLSRPQAEAIAKGMMTMVVQQFDSLVTQEHFDAHMGRIDQRLEQVDQRLDRIDTRLDNMGGRLGTMESLKSRVDLHTWMLGLIIIVLVVPQLQHWVAGV